MDFPVQTDHIVSGKAVFRNHNGQLVSFIDEAHVPVHTPLVNDPAQGIPGRAGRGTLIAAPVGVVKGGIDIQADKIQRLCDFRHIPFVRGINAVSPDGFACQHGIHPPAVAHEAVALLHAKLSCLFNFCRRFIFRNPGAGRKCNTDFHRLLCILPDGFDRRGVDKHTVPAQPGQRQIITLEGGMGALHIAVHDEAARLVDGHPPFYPVGQRFHHHLGILPEQRDDALRQPAAFFVDPHGQIPMENRHQRLDTVCQQLVHQIGIELQSFRIYLTLLGNHPGPTDGKAVGFESHFFHQRHVFFPAMIVVAGSMAGFAVLYLLFCRHIPDTGGSSAIFPAALDLGGGSRRTPEEILGERTVTHFFSLLLFSR